MILFSTFQIKNHNDDTFYLISSNIKSILLSLSKIFASSKIVTSRAHSLWGYTVIF